MDDLKEMEEIGYKVDTSEEAVLADNVSDFYFFLKRALLKGRIVLVTYVNSILHSMISDPFFFLLPVNGAVAEITVRQLETSFGHSWTIKSLTFTEALRKFSHTHFWITVVDFRSVGDVMRQFENAIPNFWEEMERIEKRWEVINEA